MDLESQIIWQSSKLLLNRLGFRDEKHVREVCERLGITVRRPMNLKELNYLLKAAGS